MRLSYRNKKTTFWVILGLVIVTMFVFKFTELRPICFFRDENSPQMLRAEKQGQLDSHANGYSYSRDMPLIFIGGVPRSGTTLMRAMLDAHPEVRCGQETRVIPRILQLRSHWLKSQKESLRLQEAGITKEVMDSAIAQFCLEIIAKHGEPAPRLCNKDPLTLKMGTYVIELFPNAKFLFMVRDGRATVHSIISRKVTITGFDLTSYRQCMTKWNAAIQTMHNQCKEIGKERCMMVYYEQLVLHPEQWMHKILDFLNVPWNDSVLHHEEFINKPNGVPLSKVERSSDQVVKPVNLEALTKWVGQIPEDVVGDMAEIAPMLSVLGYDPYSNPPNYGKPDAWVQDNTSKLKANPKLWENKVRELKLIGTDDMAKYNGSNIAAAAVQQSDSNNNQQLNNNKININNGNNRNNNNGNRGQINKPKKKSFDANADVVANDVIAGPVLNDDDYYEKTNDNNNINNNENNNNKNNNDKVYVVKMQPQQSQQETQLKYRTKPNSKSSYNQLDNNDNRNKNNNNKNKDNGKENENRQKQREEQRQNQLPNKDKAIAKNVVVKQQT